MKIHPFSPYRYARNGRFLPLSAVLALAGMAGSWFLTIQWQIRNGLFPERFQTGALDSVASIGQYFTPAVLPFWGAVVLVIVFVFVWASFKKDGQSRTIVLSTSVLTGLGIMVLLRLSPALGWLRQSPYYMQMVQRHLLWILLGLLLLILLSGRLGRILLDLGRRHWICLLGTTLLAEIVTLLFGAESSGHRLWLRIGPVSLLTVEFVKIAFVVVLSALMFPHKKQAGGDGTTAKAVATKMGNLRAALLMPAVAGLMIVPVVLQRDFGPACQLAVIACILFFLTTGRWFSCLLLLGTVAGLGFLSYHLGWPEVVKARVDMCLSPFSNSEQISQSIWAISNGGLVGVGLGRGTAHLIPVVHCDFVPALLAEELGFLGFACILGLYAAIVRGGLQIAQTRRETPFHASSAAGFSILLAIQVVLLCAGVSGLVPLTGITLPFISAGGSSLVSSFMLIGFLLCLSRKE